MQSPPTPSSPDSAVSPQRGFRLILMRHAKSDWSGDNISDHDRPLNDRGIRDAPAMARWIAEVGLLPDRIFCSSAARTQQTATLMQSYWKNTKLDTAQLCVTPVLYLASEDTILEFIKNEFGNKIAGANLQPRTVMLLAHNPGISYTATFLLGNAIGMSTAAVVAMRCKIQEWSTPLTSDNTQCITAMKPKALGSDDRFVS